MHHHLAFDASHGGQLAVDDGTQAAVDVLLADLEFGVHLGHQEPVVLEAADRLAERLAVLDVLQCLGERRAGTGDRRDRDRQPLGRQVGHQVVEALALLAKQVRTRHPDVLEVQFGGVGVVQAHLVELAAAGETLHVALDDEQREALVAGVGVGAGHDHDQVGVDARGDERLGAVEDPVVAVAHRRGLDACQVAARAGLGHRDGADQFAGDVAGQPPLLLLVVGEVDEVRADDVVLQAQPRRGGSELRELLDDHRVEPEVVDTAAAVLLRHVEADQSVFACGDVGFAVDEPLALPLLGVRRALLFQELTRGVTQLLVLGFEYQSLHVLSYLAFQTGWRFSANASGPSLASSERISVPISRMVLVQPGSSPMITPSSTPLATRLLAQTASGALTVIRSASASAASTAVPSGTT